MQEVWQKNEYVWITVPSTQWYKLQQKTTCDERQTYFQFQLKSTLLEEKNEAPGSYGEHGNFSYLSNKNSGK